MKMLFVGDIVGKLGRQTVAKVLPSLKKELEIAAVFANGENLAHGRGATKATVDEVLGYGIDYFTGGNHLFWQADFDNELREGTLPVLRPENYPKETPGRGFVTMDFGRDGKLILVSLQGRDFINQPVACPLRTLDKLLEEKPEDVKMVVVDFHAEATSEKVAAGYYFDGRVSAFLGTHTHVPTADARVLPGGTAYVTDVGMTGPQESVLGVKKEIIIARLLSPLPRRFEWVEEGPAVFQSVLVEIDEESGRAKSVERVDRYV